MYIYTGINCYKKLRKSYRLETPAAFPGCAQDGGLNIYTLSTHKYAYICKKKCPLGVRASQGAKGVALLRPSTAVGVSAQLCHPWHLWSTISNAGQGTPFQLLASESRL